MTSIKWMKIRIHRRNMYLVVILSILYLVGPIEGAALSSESRRVESGPSLSSELSGREKNREKEEEEVGNPSELAWQAWLLVDGQSGSETSGALDSASLLRRITPKSIFIAPALPACAEGYQADTMNRCVKNVNIDQEAHIDFLVQRLNAMYANVGKPQANSASSSSSSSSSSGASGPFQLNIPLLMNGPLKTVKEPPQTEDAEPQSSEKISSTTEEPSKKMIEVQDKSKIFANNRDEKISSNNQEAKISANNREAIVTVYELSEDTKENESTFFLGNRSAENADKVDKDDSTISDRVVPIAEFVDESNTNYSGIVDYKIPEAIDKILNRTKEESVSTDSNEKNDETSYEETPNRENNQELVNDNESSPTLVLLLSPTKLSPISVPNKNLIVAHNSSLGRVIIKMENVTGNVTGKEIIRVSVPETIGSSSSSSSQTKNFIENGDEDSTNRSRIEESTDVGFRDDEQDNLSIESTEGYDEENYEESTEVEDEILKHSEAGITVTIPATGERILRPDATKILSENSSSSNGDKEPTGSSKISSEVSIIGDFVRETTLVDFNVSKTPNSMSSTTSNLRNKTGNLGESKFKQQTDSKVPEIIDPEVGNSSGDLRNEKRGGEHKKSEETRFFDSLKGKLDREVVSKSVTKEKEEEETDVLDVKKNPSEINNSEVVYSVSSIEEEIEEAIRTESPSTVEKLDSSESMIAASTNDAVMIREEPKFEMASSVTRKRGGQPFKLSDESGSAFGKSFETSRPQSSTSSNAEGVFDYEPIVRDYPRRNPFEDENLPVIRTMDELQEKQQRYQPNSGFDLSSREEQDEDEQFFGAQHQDRVRFPGFEQRGRPNRVRFPSEEANSIHSSNHYKGRNRRPYDQQEQNHRRGSPTTKTVSDKEFHQKESYWWLPSDWRNERQQGIPQRSRSNLGDSRARDRPPMLLRFWTRMPLVRDPTLIYQHPTYPTLGGNNRSLNSRNDSGTSRSSSSSSSSSLSSSYSSPRGSSRRVNYYKEMSTQDLTRAFARKSFPIGG